MIQKHDLPILEYDFDSIEVIRPNHGAEQLVLPEKCVFGFLGDVIDDYAFEMDAVIAEHFETITLPLRTPTDRCLGGPLPRQQANQTHPHPSPINL